MIFRPQAVIFVLGGGVVVSAGRAVSGSAEDCQEWVDCENGFVVGKEGITCHGECAGHCCVEEYDCDGFTGRVCADEGQLSCATNYTGAVPDTRGAGTNATIPFVANSCVGYVACKLAGGNGNVGNVTRSCHGDAACDFMAYDENVAGGTVGHVTDSCIGAEACIRMASGGGTVGSLTGSCKTEFSCLLLADEGGTVGSLTNSCNEFEACVYVGTNGTVGSLTNSCNDGRLACSEMAVDGGSVGDVTNSCNGENACIGAGEGGTIGSMTNSCIGDSSCNSLAGDGTVGPMKNSCTVGNACVNMGRFGAVGAVTDSCNGGNRSCIEVARDGTVGPMTNSCNNEDEACEMMAKDGGVIGPVIESCNGFQACMWMTRDGGVIGPVEYSCNAKFGCFSMARGCNGCVDYSPYPCDCDLIQARGGNAIGPVAYSCNAQQACERVQCQTTTDADCEPQLDLDSRGIDFINGSCEGYKSCRVFMGDADGSGLTCTATTSPDVTFSPNTTTCVDTDTGSEELSTCDGSTDVCTSLCPAGDAYIPSNYWVPPLDKPGMTCENVRLKIPDQGEFSCLPIGEGICRDNGGAFGEWRFGIEEIDTPPCEVTNKCRIGTATNTFPVLIDPANTRYPITGTTYTDSETGKVCKNGLNEAIRGCNYAGTTHICISENLESDPNRYSDERPYMFFYDEKSHQYLYQLVCDGIGEEGKLPELKMVNNEDLADATYVNYPVDIVKFKKGATPNKDDANELWKMYMDWNGFEDPETKRIGKLASFIGVVNPKFCKEYVSATDKPCWKEDCNDGSVETPEDYERADCEPLP